MKKKGRRRRPKNQAEVPVRGSQIGLGAAVPEDALEIWADAVVGVLILVVLLIAKWGLAATSTFQLLEESFYDVLQLRLSSKLDEKQLKVVVVDITDMKMDRAANSRRYDFTDRGELQQLVRKLVTGGPRAIGLDTDFTPYAVQRQQDHSFLDACLLLRYPPHGSQTNPVPVYVGLHDAVGLGPDLCLAEPQYGVLAAFIGFPNVNEHESRRWTVEWMKIPYDDEAGQKRKWLCPSLAAAVTTQHVSPPPAWISWAADDVTFTEPNAFYSGKKFDIDYSPLEALEENSVPLRDIDSYLGKDYFRDKYVFVGRGKLSHDTGDKYPIPGRRGDAHSGVYIHACAAYTLLRRPLFAVKLWGDIVLDCAVGLPVIFVVAWIRFHYRRLEHHAVLAFITLLAVLVVIGVGFFMVNVTRLMWDDFVVVAASLLLHQSLESTTGPLTERLVHSLPLAWRSSGNRGAG